MGCNTSKESAVPQENESKGNQNGAVENNVESVENETPNITKDSAENRVNESASAKTITLRSNGSAKSSATDDRQADSVPEQQAATKIQAAFRGHQTRKSMKQPAKGKGEEAVVMAAEEPTREQLEEEFRTDDKELCHAATKIQASFRGHMSRKLENEKNNEESSSTKDNKPEADETLDIDLTDPDLNKAAVKIQASFRGHMTRKEQEGDIQQDN